MLHLLLPGASREGFYTNQPLTDLLLQAQKMTDQKKRAELYREAEQMIHDDVSRIFIATQLSRRCRSGRT